MSPGPVVASEEVEVVQDLLAVEEGQPTEAGGEGQARGPGAELPEPEKPEAKDLSEQWKEKLTEMKLSDLMMEQLKSREDLDGLGKRGGDAVEAVFGKDVRKRLWTKADFAHIHAITGGVFLGAGLPWLLLSHGRLISAADPDAVAFASNYASPFLGILAVAGALNAVSAVPMSRFSSNKLLDLKDLKANGFTLGGTGLTMMCLWSAWWFSGSYPAALDTDAARASFYAVWVALCVSTTANWEVMLQQNFEDNEGTKKVVKSRSGQEAKKMKKKQMSEKEKAQKKFLYRLASWPNLTQLLFLYSPCFGGREWFAGVLANFPAEQTAMYHYSLGSALGYALSMFSETLRDRKLVTLEQDLAILLFTFLFPSLEVVLDGATIPGATANPLEYWQLFPDISAACARVAESVAEAAR
jgi:hypothetical protein